jgi:hypothetical protein
LFAELELPEQEIKSHGKPGEKEDRERRVGNQMVGGKEGGRGKKVQEVNGARYNNKKRKKLQEKSKSNVRIRKSCIGTRQGGGIRGKRGAEPKTGPIYKGVWVGGWLEEKYSYKL